MTARVSNEVFMIYCWQIPLSRCWCNCEAWTVPIIHYMIHFCAIYLEIGSACLCVGFVIWMCLSDSDPGPTGSPVLEGTRNVPSCAHRKDVGTWCCSQPRRKFELDALIGDNAISWEMQEQWRLSLNMRFNLSQDYKRGKWIFIQWFLLTVLIDLCREIYFNKEVPLWSQWVWSWLI